jgi:hypothetical protein
MKLKLINAEKALLISLSSSKTINKKPIIKRHYKYIQKIAEIIKENKYLFYYLIF